MVKSKLQQRLDSITVNGLLSLLSLISIFPVVYALSSSFKGPEEIIVKPPQFFPQNWSLDGYQQVFMSDLFRYHLPNTFINAFGASVLTVLLGALAAYAFSRYKFWGSRVLQVFILGLIMIPSLTNLVPLYRMASELGLLNTNAWMITLYLALGLPFGIWVIKTFIDSVPVELEEAAMIDGCNAIGALWYIVVPIAIPGLAAAFLMQFVYNWNEFLFAVVMLSKNSMKTATVGLYDFQASFQIAYNVWMAACIMIILPVVVTFFLLRKTFFRAMLQGAIKG